MAVNLKSSAIINANGKIGAHASDRAVPTNFAVMFSLTHLPATRILPIPAACSPLNVVVAPMVNALMKATNACGLMVTAQAVELAVARAVTLVVVALLTMVAVALAVTLAALSIVDHLKLLLLVPALLALQLLAHLLLLAPPAFLLRNQSAAVKLPRFASKSPWTSLSRLMTLRLSLNSSLPNLV